MKLPAALFAVVAILVAVPALSAADIQANQPAPATPTVGPATAGAPAKAGYTDTYFISDRLATTVASIDARGIINRMETDAFGAPIAKGTHPTRYTGKPWDEDIGAYIFPYRNYRPDEARWMTPDPSGFPDGMNALTYPANPTNSVDRMGLNNVVLWAFAEPANGQNYSGNSADTDLGTAASVYVAGWQIADPTILYHTPSDINSGESLVGESTGNVFAFTTLVQLSDIGANVLPQLITEDTTRVDVFVAAHGNFDVVSYWWHGRHAHDGIVFGINDDTITWGAAVSQIETSFSSLASSYSPETPPMFVLDSMTGCYDNEKHEETTSWQISVGWNKRTSALLSE
jgi:RHS repeat-associated protein